MTTLTDADAARLVALYRDRIRAELAIPPIDGDQGPERLALAAELGRRGRDDIADLLAQENRLHAHLRAIATAARATSDPDRLNAHYRRGDAFSTQLRRVVRWVDYVLRTESPVTWCWAHAGANRLHLPRTVASGLTVCGLTITAPVTSGSAPRCLACQAVPR